MERKINPLLNIQKGYRTMGSIINPYSFGKQFDYTLDIITGASSAYSLRKLRAAYSGYCISVIRSDATIINIGFKGKMLDVDALLAFAGSGDVNVVVWYDQSGNGRDTLLETGIGIRPLIVSAGNLIKDINGNPAISFNGLGYLKSFKFDLPNTNWCVSVISLKKLGSSYSGVLGTTQENPYNSKGFYMDVSSIIFNKSGAIKGIVNSNTPSTTQLSITSISHKSNNTAKVVLNNNDMSYVSALIGGTTYTDGTLGYFRLAFYATAYTIADFEGIISEVVSYQSDVDMLAFNNSANTY